MDDFVKELIARGMSQVAAEEFAMQYTAWQRQLTPEACWQQCQVTLDSGLPFAVHHYIYQTIYHDKFTNDELAPAWFPDDALTAQANLAQLMRDQQLASVSQAHEWSVTNYQHFWQWVINKLNINFKEPYQEIADLTAGIEQANWLPGAKLNIVDSCLQSEPTAAAVIYQNQEGELQQYTYQQLECDVNCFAMALANQGFEPGDNIAINMPMNYFSVVSYLGVIKAGCVVVAIADSFAPEEITTRFEITNPVAIITQDVIGRNGKQLKLYEKVKAAKAPKAIVVVQNDDTILRNGDLSWQEFMANTQMHESVSCEPSDAINVLFSSGTTGTPKAIPWDHTTAIKVASDAFFHQNIKAGDVLAWPTNLGWMMGPWLIFAALLNRGTIALYDGAPTEPGFGEFVERAEITMLGVVPSLVKAWRNSQCMEAFDWSAIKVFSSSGECSNRDDMLYLMYLANYKPIIEYCGGTEIGGGYISSTVLQPNVPAAFTSAAMGSDFIILDDQGKAADFGEIALLPPAMGLSTRLINADHHKIYYDNMPSTRNGRVLRRHGDQAKKYPCGYYRLLGRVDDTMNLSGIKIGAADIERALAEVAGIIECAAISVNPEAGGPSQLVLYCVPEHFATEKSKLAQFAEKKSKTAQSQQQAIFAACQQAIREHLNPLFKVHELVLVDALPRTASNKVMRRVLRSQYES